MLFSNSKPWEIDSANSKMTGISSTTDDRKQQMQYGHPNRKYLTGSFY